MGIVEQRAGLGVLKVEFRTSRADRNADLRRGNAIRHDVMRAEQERSEAQGIYPILTFAVKPHAGIRDIPR